MGAKGAVQPKTRFDGLKWTLVFLLVAAGIVANEYFATVAWSIRAAVGIIAAAVVLLIAAQTAKGQKAWGFFKGSRTELRKVAWPSRQETVQTTLIVVAVVVLMALILWGLDSLFMWFVGQVTA